MSEAQEDAILSAGPIASADEAEVCRQILAAAEAQYADGSEVPERATSLIASTKHKLAEWDAQQQSAAEARTESEPQ